MSAVAVSCAKVRFTSRRRARKSRQRIIGDGRGDQRMRPYLCNDCGFWHLGHLSTAVRRGQSTREQAYYGDDRP